MSDPDTILEDALIEAFNLALLTRMLRRQLGVILEHEVDTHQGLKFIVSGLVEISTKSGWRDDLLRGALAENPKHPALQKAAMILKVYPLRAPAEPHASVFVDSQETTGVLEKLARERGVSIAHQVFAKRLLELGHQMCRIEFPSGSARGTGWLVGPDLILTNYHVFEPIGRREIPPSAVICRFDYFAEAVAGVACRLAPEWLLASSPCAQGDVRADAAEPTNAELDFALLRLDREVGRELAPAQKYPRGWSRFNTAPSVVSKEDILMIPQFPDGRRLELSFGKALEYNNSASRLRHDANTEPGSSGAPCLTMALEPVALHQAGGIGRSTLYNQCIPLRLIVPLLENWTNKSA